MRNALLAKKTLVALIAVAAMGAFAQTPAKAEKATDTKADTSKVAKAKVTGSKSCDDLKAGVAAKIEANGVKTYTLDIVPTAEVKDGKVVGTCGGGSKKIVYKKG